MKKSWKNDAKGSNFPYEAPGTATAEHKDFQNMGNKPLREGVSMATHIKGTKGDINVQETIANAEPGQGATAIGE